MAMSESLGDRLKLMYEDRTRYLLPRKTYTIVRVDGRSFAGYTKRLTRPFDYDFMADMDQAAIGLCKQLSGAVMAFVFSDEISVLMTDLTGPKTDALFDGNLQKLTSISASTATAYFTRLRLLRELRNGMSVEDAEVKVLVPTFDSRVFTISQQDDAALYFFWRQSDTIRNSVASAARSVFSHKELLNMGCAKMKEMLLAKEIIWDAYPAGARLGRVIVRRITNEPIEYMRDGELYCSVPTERTRWMVEDAPLFEPEGVFVKGKIADYFPKENEVEGGEGSLEGQVPPDTSQKS